MPPFGMLLRGLALVAIGLILFVVLRVSVLDRTEAKPHELCSSPQSIIDPQVWRPVNRVLADFKPDLAERIQRLEAANAPADNPEVIQLARDVIDGIPPSAGVSPIKESLSIDQTPQAKSIDTILKGMRDGFFIEGGAFDGERSSNTIWLEKHRGWTGMLLEMDPFYYTQILGRNRRVWSANVCLSPIKQITSLTYSESHNQLGNIKFDPTKPKTNVMDQAGKYRSSFVPCFPLESLLSAINQTRVDYFSLDVEGFELEVLETIPWSMFDIRTLSVEHVHVRRGIKALVDFMASKGYRKEAELHSNDHCRNIFVNDLIFVKN